MSQQNDAVDLAIGCLDAGAGSAGTAEAGAYNGDTRRAAGT
jgi:hypothetical protein